VHARAHGDGCTGHHDPFAWARSSEDELDTDNITAQPGGTDGGDGSSSPSNPPPPSFSAGSSHRNVHEPFAEQEGEQLGIERLQEGMLLLASAEELEKRFVAFTERCVSRLEAGKTGECTPRSY
jgi:hypothetical protein